MPAELSVRDGWAGRLTSLGFTSSHINRLAAAQCIFTAFSTAFPHCTVITAPNFHHAPTQCMQDEALKLGQWILQFPHSTCANV